LKYGVTVKTLKGIEKNKPLDSNVGLFNKWCLNHKPLLLDAGNCFKGLLFLSLRAIPLFKLCFFTVLYFY